MTTAKGSILVTGAGGGLGSAIAERIASSPELSAYHGLYAVRNITQTPALTSALAHGTTHTHDFVAIDLTKLDSVRQVAASFITRVSTGEIPPINAIILCAGFQDFGKQTWTDQGLDTTFAANYLGHWLLTLLLLESVNKETGRIIVVGSQAHDTKDPRNRATKAFVETKYQNILSDAGSFEAIAKGEWSPATEDDSFRGGFRRYGASKLFLIIMQHELQARLSKDPALNRICVLGVDPGTMISGLQRHAPWVIHVLIFKVIYPVLLYFKPTNGPVRQASQSAKDILGAAFETGDGGELPKDKYFDGTTPFETSDESNDLAKRELVWKGTVKLVGLKEADTALANWQ